MDTNQVQAMMNYAVGDNLNIQIDTQPASNSGGYFSYPELSCWQYWQNYYYPQVIRESYPVYIRERAEDKGKQAFEIIKMLKDSRFLKLDTVGDFIDLMDKLIKIL